MVMTWLATFHVGQEGRCVSFGNRNGGCGSRRENSGEEMEAPDMGDERDRVSSMAATTAVELSFPCHSLVAAHYLSIPPALLEQRLHVQGGANAAEERVISTRYLETSVLERRRPSPPPRDVSAQIASYADQVKEMKGRIDWLQESLRQNGSVRRSSSGAAAEEHAQDLGKFFAAQSVKVEELGQQIDVFSEELRRWEVAELNTLPASVDRHDSFSLAGAVTREVDGLPRRGIRPAETVRIQLSDLVQRRDQSPSLSISRNDLEMKRKAMGTRMAKAKQEAKRRRVQEVVKLPFKVGIPAASRRGTDSRKSQGVRTVQLRRSNNMNSAGGASSSGVQNCITGLQREVLRLKEILEDRDQQLSTEQRKRYDLENRHAVEVRVFLKEAEDRTRQYTLEQGLRAEAEHKIADLEAELRKAAAAAAATPSGEADNSGSGVMEKQNLVVSNDAEEQTVQDDIGVVDQEQEHQEVDDASPCSPGLEEASEDSLHNVIREVPVTFSSDASRFYGREIAMNSTQLRQALKLKSIAEAKVENLKKQLVGLKKANDTLHEHQQHSRHRRESTGGDTEKFQSQLQQLKKQLADKTKELESEQAKRCDDERASSATVARLESEVVTYKKLAMEKASDLRVERKHRCKIESELKELKNPEGHARPDGDRPHSYDASSYRYNRRLQLKKSRHQYEQLHDFWKDHSRLRGVCSAVADRLEELDTSLQELASELDTLPRRKQAAERSHREYSAQQSSNQQAGDCECQPSPNDGTSEKLLFLLDRLAKGLESEHSGVDQDDRKQQTLVSEMRNQVKGLAKTLRDELQQDESNSVGDGQLQQQEQHQLGSSGSSHLTPAQEVAQLGRLCAFQGKKLRAAEGRLLALKKHVSRLKRAADETNKDLEQERSSRVERRGDRGDSNIGRVKLLEIQLLEYKRQAEEKAKDLKHERSLRFDLESRSASDIQRLKQELDVMVVAIQQQQQLQQNQQQLSRDVNIQVEASPEMNGLETLEMHVFVLELLVEEKSEALWHERQERSEAETRSKELATLLSYAQVEIANANERADELCHVSVCQGHKVVELTALLELFAKRLHECDDGSNKVSLQEHPPSELLAVDSLACDNLDEFGEPTKEQQHAAAKLKSCEDFITNLKKHVKDLELSEEVLRYRDKVWRRGLLAFDQVLLLCFGALFAFNRITILLRDTVPT